VVLHFIAQLPTASLCPLRRCRSPTPTLEPSASPTGWDAVWVLEDQQRRRLNWIWERGDACRCAPLRVPATHRPPRAPRSSPIRLARSSRRWAPPCAVLPIPPLRRQPRSSHSSPTPRLRHPARCVPVRRIAAHALVHSSTSDSGAIKRIVLAPKNTVVTPPLGASAASAVKEKGPSRRRSVCWWQGSLRFGEWVGCEA
jgi:hypothetical protein